MKKPPRRTSGKSITLRELAARVEERLSDPVLPPEWSEPDAPELLAYDLGDVEPLRRRHPQIARAIHAPRPPARGKYVRKPKDRPSAIVGAATDVPRIRVVLRDMYGRKRPPFNAAKVAAEIWGADVDELEKYLKPSGGRKPRPA